MTSPSRYDLLVVGGGMTGLALAAACARGGASVALVERHSLEATTAPPFDGRVTAVARGSMLLLDGIGIWPALIQDAQPIRDIRVGERHSPLGVHYDHRAVGGEPLGYIVENRHLRTALLAAVRDLEQAGRLRVEAPATITLLVRESSAVGVRLDDGSEIEAACIAACEGRSSPTRALAGIDVTTWSYGQSGIVATIGHEHAHGGFAVERFFPTGPFAILPMTGKRSSIVWAADNALADEMVALDDEAFVEELGERFGPAYGALELASPRFRYPLSLTQATRYTDCRLALIGDAARAIHPIAGQGWNLALRDVGAMAEMVVDAKRLGLDPGAPEQLERYERWRRFDSLALIAVTDGLNRLFGNDLLPVRIARELGLALVQATPPLKQFFMRHAMGALGDLPRLMRGQAL